MNDDIFDPSRWGTHVPRVPRFPGGSGPLLRIAVPAIALWLWVGIWRAASRYKLEHALQNKNAGWAVVAKIMVVLGVV